jgi:hypothetical protein
VRLGLPLRHWRGALQWLCLRGGIRCVDYRAEIHDARLVDIFIYCLWSDRALIPFLARSAPTALRCNYSFRIQIDMAWWRSRVVRDCGDAIQQCCWDRWSGRELR